MSTLGDTLRSAREKRSLTIDDVSARTKVRKPVVDAIENDRLDFLPGPYMKSFVKTYANFLNISKEEIDELLRQSFNQPAKVNGSEEIQETTTPTQLTVEQMLERNSTNGTSHSLDTKPSSVVNKLVYSGLSLAIVSLAYYFVVIKPAASEQTLDYSSVGTTPLEINASQSETPIRGSDVTSTNPIAIANAPNDSLYLEAHTTDSVWISMVIDGQRSLQFTMEPNAYYRWSAGNLFKISLGNAGGVRFTLNGKPAEPLGPLGSVLRDVRVTHEGIICSNLRSVSAIDDVEESPQPLQEAAVSTTTAP